MRKIVGVLFTVLWAFLIVPTVSHAASESPTLSIVADKTTLNPGDKVNFDVILGNPKGTGIGGVEYELEIPEGLSLVSGSFKTSEAFNEEVKGKQSDLLVPSDGKLKYMWMPKTNSDGSQYLYTGKSLCLLQFSCTVDANAALGKKSVGFAPANPAKPEEGSSVLVIDGLVNTLTEEGIPATLTVEKAKVSVSGVSLNQTALTLKDGETAKLAAAVAPSNADDKSVTWSSDTISVATVAADGTVTAVKAGTAKITVKTKDGGKTASCTVTVSCSHAMNKTEAKAADCVNDGNIEYYTCSKCNKKYADAAGAKEITDVAVKAKGHAGTEVGSDTDNHWKICAACGAAFDKSAHSYKWKVDLAATEDATGLKHEECDCGAKRSENTVLDKLDHVHIKIERHKAVAATCKEKGNVEYWTCGSDKCEGKYYGDAACQTEIKTVETPVNPDNHVYDNGSDDTCNLCGYVREIDDEDDDDTEPSPAPAAVQVPPAVSPKTGEARQLTLAIGIIAAGMVLAAGWILYRKKESRK